MPRPGLLLAIIGLWLCAAGLAAGQTSDPEAALRAQGSAALQALREGQAIRAVDLAREARDQAAALGLRRLEASLRQTLARCLSGLGDQAAAMRELEQAEAIYVALGDEEARLRTVSNRGIVARLLGDLPEALRLQQFVLDAAERSGRPVDIVGALINIGIVEFNRGNYRAAAGHLERALTFEVDEEQRLNVVGNLALVYGSQGQFALALQYSRDAADGARRAGDVATEAIRRLNIAATLNEMGRHDEALAEIAATLPLVEAGDFRAVVGLRYERAFALRALGRFAEAADAYERAVARARAGAEPEDVVLSLSGLASVQSRLGAHDAATATAREAVDAAVRFDGPRVSVVAQHALGEALRAAGDEAGAERAFDAAIAAVERLRAQTAGGDAERLRFFAEQLPPYHAQVALLAARGRFAEALGYMERARSRVLVEVLQRGRDTLPGALTAADRARERNLTARVAAATARRAAAPDAVRAAAETELTAARQDVDAFRLQMLARYPRSRLAAGDVGFAGVEAMRPFLETRSTAILAYTVTDQATFLAVLRGGPTGAVSLRLHTLPVGRADLGRAVDDFRRRLAARDLGVAEIARAQFTRLVGPAEADLAGVRRLIVVPDAVLWELPFQALQDQSGRYLLERLAVTYAPSLTALVSLPRDPVDPGADSLLALGNPAHPGQPLVEAERQVEAIARLFPADRRRVAVRGSATEALVRAEAARARVVHVAAHGTLDAASPMYSALLLTPDAGAGDDGRLEAREIVDLDLRADLVVLSACESALGRVASGEGLIGLSWATLVAGARRTVVSQWKVDAASTTALLTGFYRRYRGGPGRPGVDAAEALRAAALALRRQPGTRHPFYWAPFVLVGG